MATNPTPTQPDKLQLLQTPAANALERLKAGKPKQAKPVDYSESLPARYNRDLNKIITAINEDVKANVLPAVYQQKAEYTADAWPTVMNALLTALTERWTGDLFKAQADRLAAGTIRRIEAENGQAFLNSVNGAVGIEVFGANSQAITTQLEAASIENANLIKDLSDQHVKRISTTILERMRGGYAPSVIAKDLQKVSGISRRRAKNIARDQTSKLNGELTKQRNLAAGIEFFRWVDSDDSRVGDDHRRAANRDIGYGKGVYRWDKPPKEGIPGRSTRPFCRCTAAPVFPWELP